MNESRSSTNAVNSQISFITRDDRFSEEKPYILRYLPADGFPAQNISTHTANVSIADLRSQNPMAYDECGIKVLTFETSMQRQDFESKDTVHGVYLPLLQDAVKKYLNANDVKVIPHIVELPEPHYAMYKIRRQPPGFPQSTGGRLEREVPATVAHIGEAMLLQLVYVLLMVRIDATEVELRKAITRCGVGHLPEDCRVEWVKYSSLFALPMSVTDLMMKCVGAFARSG